MFVVLNEVYFGDGGGVELYCWEELIDELLVVNFDRLIKIVCFNCLG